MDQEKSDVITREQIRAARGLLGWSQTQLAERAGMSLPTVKRMETATGPNVSEEARARILGALERAGVRFIAESDEGPGVRLRRPLRKTSTANRS